MKYYLYYLLLINLFSFILAIADKIKAKKNLRRVRESDLILLSVIGGSIGMLLGLLISNHKTSKIKFMLGIPCIIIVQILIMSVLLR